ATGGGRSITPLRGQAGDERRQLERIDRLGDVSMKASFEHEGSVLGPRICRQRQGTDLAPLPGTERTYLANQDVSVVARHPDVADPHIRPPAPQARECS